MTQKPMKDLDNGDKVTTCHENSCCDEPPYPPTSEKKPKQKIADE